MSLGSNGAVGNELAKHRGDEPLPHLFCSTVPLPPSGFTYQHPLVSQPYIANHDSNYHPLPPDVPCHQVPYSGHLSSVYASHPATVIRDVHPSPESPAGGPPHPFQHPATNYYMNQMESPLIMNQPPHSTNHLSESARRTSEDISYLGHESRFNPPFNNGTVSVSSPFVKQEPGSNPFVKQEPGALPEGIPFIKQEPGVIPENHLFIKQEPGAMHDGVPFTKQQFPGTLPLIKQEPRPCVTFIKQDSLINNGSAITQGLSQCNPTQEVFTSGGGVSFPSRPLNLNFMADIEDIVQPTNSEVTIDSIKTELSCFEGPSDNKLVHRKVGVFKEEGEELSWEPPLWQQQYENIRTMRSKRDAPVDKYGCFMNAEKEVAPEIRRYQILVSLMMSSQTKDEVVGKAMTKLKENGLTVNNILNTPQEEIARMIFPVGFWNKKAEYIKKTTKILKEKFNSDIPDSVDGLISLPGIGPKMAHLIMDFAWGQVSGIAVDTHVHRITHRLGWMRKETRNPEEARKSLEKWFPKSEWSELNLLCVGFGQQVCSPVGPKCSECLNKDMCPSSSCLVSSGLPLGIGFEVSTKSKGKKVKSSPMDPRRALKKIKIESNHHQ